MPDRYPVVCITGGSGYFGQAMTRQLLATTDKTVIRCLSRGEWLQKQAKAALEDAPRVRWLLGDVRDRARLDIALQGVDLVIHAAALKHIDKAECDPNEAVLTNTMGAMHVAGAAMTAGVQQAIFLSSDKAVAPTTVYGSTKLVAEKAWIQQNAYSPTRTRFAAVRYGNVAGSRGSVLEVFAQQLARGKPLQVTDLEATRFWMDIDEATALVSWVAMHALRGGVVVPQLPAFSMLDLLTAIEQYLNKSLAYNVIGLRPAEKKHEVLALPEELAQAAWYAPAAHIPVFYVLPPHYATWSPPVWDCEAPQDCISRPVRGEGPVYLSYNSGTSAWRLTVEDLVQKLRTMAWGEPANHHQ